MRGIVRSRYRPAASSRLMLIPSTDATGTVSTALVAANECAQFGVSLPQRRPNIPSSCRSTASLSQNGVRSIQPSPGDDSDGHFGWRGTIRTVIQGAPACGCTSGSGRGGSSRPTPSTYDITDGVGACPPSSRPLRLRASS